MKPNRPKTITERLESLLLKGREITGLTGYDLLGTLSVRNRICDLEKRGWQIEHTPIQRNGKRYMSYKLIQAP